MKKFFILLTVTIIFSACNTSSIKNNDTNMNKSISSTTEKVMTTSKETSSVKNEEGLMPKYPLIRTVMLDNTLYYDMNEMHLKVTCGTPDGEFIYEVSENEFPKRNEECNFSGPVKYQVYHNGGRPVYYREKWMRFCKKTPLQTMLENSDKIKSIKFRSQEERFNPKDEIVYDEDEIKNFVAKMKNLKNIPIRMDEEKNGWTKLFTVEINDDEKYLISIMDDVMKVNKVYYQIGHIDFDK